MNLDIRDPRLHDILDADTEIEQLATGFDFLEGPVWSPSNNSLIFSDIMGNSLYRWTEADGVRQLRRNSYMANGNTLDHQGRLITCEHATSRLTRTDFANDTYEVLASHYQGKQLNSPNDVVVKSDGTIYFTDPMSGRSEGYGVPRASELGYVGVYKLEPETGLLSLLATNFTLPNGLCFSKDESKLFVNDTREKVVKVFDVSGDGMLENGRLFAKTVGELPGVPDGMKVDIDENLYTCGPGGIQLFDKEGVCLGVILMPEQTANFVFGGTDMRDLYVTASTSLYRLRVKVSGLNAQ